MSGSRLLLAELASDLRCYLIQNKQSALIGSAQMMQFFSKEKKAVSQHTPAFMPSARPQVAVPYQPPKKVIIENIPAPQPNQVKVAPKPIIQSTIAPKVAADPDEIKTPSSLKPTSTPLLKKYLSENASTLKFLEHTPEDTEARSIRSRWLLEQMTVAIFVATQGEEEERFIQAVAKGINERLSPAYFPDKELPLHYLPREELLSHSNLRLILTTRSFLLSDPALRKGCSGTTDDPLLFGKPLLILDPLSHYLTSQKQKGELWEKIKQSLQVL